MTRPRGLDRQTIAARFKVSLASVDRALTDVKPIRPTIKGKQRALYRESDVKRALATGTSLRSEPGARLIRAHRVLVRGAIARLEAAHLPAEDVRRAWGRIVAKAAAQLEPWPAAVADQLARYVGLEGRRLAAAVREDLVRPLLERIAETPVEAAASAPARAEVAEDDALTPEQLQAALLADRARLAELRHDVKPATGKYFRRADVEFDWPDRGALAREVLWSGLPSKLAFASAPDLAELRRLLEAAVAEALEILRRGPSPDAPRPESSHPSPITRSAKQEKRP